MRLGNELGVKITQMCLCVDVQLCLIAMTAVMFAQGRILADQLSYFTMQEKTSKSIFLKKKWMRSSTIYKQNLVRNLEQ